MSAPTIEWLRPGVGYTPAAAASMRRLEAGLGRAHDCNSSYRDYAKQLSMYLAWTAYTQGRGPKPPHSRAMHPDASMHCKGLADDSDDWRTPGYIALAAEYGWIRTAANDPTEQHHFEYQIARDQHRNDPIPSLANVDSKPFPMPTALKPKGLPLMFSIVFDGSNKVDQYAVGPGGRVKLDGQQADLVKRWLAFQTSGGVLSKENALSIAEMDIVIRVLAQVAK